MLSLALPAPPIAGEALPAPVVPLGIAEGMTGGSGVLERLRVRKWTMDGCGREIEGGGLWEDERVKYS